MSCNFMGTVVNSGYHCEFAVKRCCYLEIYKSIQVVGRWK